MTIIYPSLNEVTIYRLKYILKGEIMQITRADMLEKKNQPTQLKEITGGQTFIKVFKNHLQENPQIKTKKSKHIGPNDYTNSLNKIYSSLKYQYISKDRLLCKLDNMFFAIIAITFVKH